MNIKHVSSEKYENSKEIKNTDTITKLSGTVCCTMCLGCLLKMRTDFRFLETFCQVFFTYKRGS